MKKCLVFSSAHAALNLNTQYYNDGIDQLRHDTYIRDELLEPPHNFTWNGCASTDGPLCFTREFTAAQITDGFYSQRLSPERGLDSEQVETLELPRRYQRNLFIFDEHSRQSAFDLTSAPRQMRIHETRAQSSEITFQTPMADAAGVHYYTAPPVTVSMTYSGSWRTVRANVNGTSLDHSALEIQSSFASISFGKPVALMAVSIARRCAMYHRNDATPITIIGRNKNEEVFSETIMPWELSEMFVNGAYFHATTQAHAITELWFMLAECIQIKHLRIGHSERNESTTGSAFLLTFRDGWKAVDGDDVIVNRVVDHYAPLTSLHNVITTNRRLNPDVRMDAPKNLENSTKGNAFGIVAPFNDLHEHREWSGAKRDKRQLLRMLKNWSIEYEKGVQMEGLIEEIDILAANLDTKKEGSGLRYLFERSEDSFSATWRRLGLPNLTIAFFRHGIARSRGIELSGNSSSYSEQMLALAEKFEATSKSDSRTDRLNELMQKVFGLDEGFGLEDDTLNADDGTETATLEESEPKEDIRTTLRKAIDAAKESLEKLKAARAERDNPSSVEGSEIVEKKEEVEAVEAVATETVEEVATETVEEVAEVKKEKKQESVEERLAALEEADDTSVGNSLSDHADADATDVSEAEDVKLDGAKESKSSTIRNAIEDLLNDLGAKGDGNTDAGGEGKKDFAFSFGLLIDGRMQMVSGSSVEEIMSKIEALDSPELNGNLKSLRESVETAFANADLMRQKALGMKSARDKQKKDSDAKKESGTTKEGDESVGSESDGVFDDIVLEEELAESLFGKDMTAQDYDYETLQSFFGAGQPNLDEFTGQFHAVEMTPEEFAKFVTEEKGMKEGDDKTEEDEETMGTLEDMILNGGTDFAVERDTFVEKTEEDGDL